MGGGDTDQSNSHKFELNRSVSDDNMRLVHSSKKCCKRDLAVELPFTLTHPKPEQPVELVKIENLDKISDTNKNDNGNNNKNKNGSDQTVPVDLNLIEFDTNLSNCKTNKEDDDLIFEEFARIRLKGHDPDDTDV